MGGSPSTPPAPPQPPSYAQQVNDYIGTLPSQISAMQQYGPQYAQADLALQQQYAPQYKQIQDNLYPELTALRNQLTQQATVGAQNGGLTDAMKQQYQDQFRAEIGGNNGSGIGADYVSRNMVNQAQQYQQFNQNLGLSLIGAQPLYNQAQSTQAAQSIGQGQNSALNYGANTYGNYVGAYASMPGTGGGNLGGVGSALGMGLGALFAAPTGGMSMGMGAMLGGGMGGGLGSSIRY